MKPGDYHSLEKFGEKEFGDGLIIQGSLEVLKKWFNS